MNSIPRKLIPVLICLAIVVAYFSWPTPLEKQLQNLLNNLIVKTSITSTVPVFEAQIRAADLAKFFSKEIKVHYRAPDEEFERVVSRAQIQQALAAVAGKTSYAKSGYSKFKLISSTSTSAKVSLFFIAEWKEGEELNRAAEDVQLEFSKADGEWIISSVETFPR